MRRRRKKRAGKAVSRLPDNQSSPYGVRPAPFPELVAIPPQHVTDVWNLCEDHIKAALEGTEFSADQVKEQCANSDNQLWFAWSGKLEAVAVTTVCKTPTGRVCIIVAAGGTDMSRWLGLLDGIEDWARKAGVKTMRIFGRKGWARMLPDYQAKRIVLDKDL